MRSALAGTYGRWIAACALGELAGIGTAAGAAIGLARIAGEPHTLAQKSLALAVMTAAGAVEGAALGTLQWRVLRAQLPRLRAREWVGVTVFVAVLGWVAGMAGPIFGSGSGAGAAAAAAVPPAEPSLGVVLGLAAAMGAGAGACFGAAQWVVLRRHAAQAGRWIWVHVPAWAAAMALIFAGASLPSAGWPGWAIVLSGLAGGLAGGLALGAISGLVARGLRPWVDERAWSLAGRVAAVTGATAGIGREIAVGLARLGATIVVLCREEHGAAETFAAIRAAAPAADVHAVRCDLASLRSVRAAAAALRARWHRLDLLVHDAGTIEPVRTLTAEAIERTLAVDVVGPFLLTTLLQDRLEENGGRVVALAGIYHRRARVDLADLHFARRRYDWIAASNQAQALRVAFVAELARRAPRLTAVAVHPGAVRTRALAAAPPLLRLLAATLARPAFVRPELGALPALRLAAAPALGGVTGRFFDRFRLAPDRPDPSLSARFWEVCARMTAGRGEVEDIKSVMPETLRSAWQ